MDFKQLNECFKGCIFADDYRADTQEHHVQSETLRRCQFEMSVVDSTASGLLFRAIQSCQRGDFAAVDSVMAQLRDLARPLGDGRLLSRCAVYDVLFRSLKCAPPTLRFRVDSDTCAGLVRACGLSALRARFLRRRMKKRHPQEQSGMERLESDVVKIVTGFPTELYLEAFPANPKFPKILPISLFSDSKNYLCAVTGPAMLEELPGIASYLVKLNLAYVIAADADGALRLLSNAYGSCIDSMDFIGAANVLMQQGDSILSPPFTSPLALNLIPVVRELGWTYELWDAKEAEYRLIPNSQAAACYTEANSLFQQAQSLRGQAAIFLRCACLDLSEVLAGDSIGSGGGEERTALLNSARQHLTVSGMMFGEDSSHALIVNGHQIVLAILETDYAKALDLAFDIGLVGKALQNTSVAEFVGVLLLRLGRSLSLDPKGMDRAIACATCAEACFRALEDPILELHAVVALASAQRGRGDLPMASRHIERGRSLLDRVVARFDHLEAQTEEIRTSFDVEDQKFLDADLDSLRRARTNVLAEFDRVDSATTGASQTQPTSQLSQGLISDPAMKQLFENFIPGMRELERLRQDYHSTIDRYRAEKMLSFDIDAAERYLRELLVRLDEFPGPFISEEVETMKVATLIRFGDFQTARAIIGKLLPPSFTGSRGAMLVGDESTDEQLQALLRRNEYQKEYRAFGLCFLAKDWKRGLAGVENMLLANSASLHDLKASAELLIWEKIVWVGCILEKAGRRELAFEWYAAAYERIEAERQQLADVADRRELLATTHSGEIFVGLARLAIELGKVPTAAAAAAAATAQAHQQHAPLSDWELSPSEWKHQALRFLEQGRSRTLLDILWVERASPEHLRQWSEYSYQLRASQALRRMQQQQQQQQLSNGSTGVPSEEKWLRPGATRELYLREMLARLQTELETLTLARLVPNSQLFVAANKAIFACIPANALVVHISSGREGMIFLCISTDGIVDIQPTATTQLDLDRHVLRLMKLFRNLRSCDAASLPSLPLCNEHLLAISKLVIGPVQKHFSHKEHIIFVPSPALNKVPLSALIYDEKPLVLSKDVSQVPSLSVLQFLAEKHNERHTGVNVVYKDPWRGDPLDISTSAAINIAHDYGVEPLPADASLTHQAFADTYEASSVLLIATHGTQNYESAWESSLLLHPVFRVLDLARLRSRAALVVFEACVSGLGEESIGNDLLGFSHAVLASGATAFLGGLWKVGDEASALLMVFLFDELRRGRGSASLARCWRNAQRRLYTLDVDAAVEVLDGLQSGCAAAREAGLIDDRLARQLRKTLRIAVRDMRAEGINFKHPFFWAPFVLMGNAGLVLE